MWISHQEKVRFVTQQMLANCNDLLFHKMPYDLNNNRNSIAKAT